MAAYVGQIKHGANVDERRIIDECNSPEGGFSVQDFTIDVGNLPLGNHYHRNKTEIFKITGGRGLFFAAEVGDDGRPGEISVHNVLPGTCIKVPPGTTHAFLLDAGSTMTCFSSEVFDPQDMPFCPLVKVDDETGEFKLLPPQAV